MSLRRALVADRAAVSPVVGTILMVAITVVLVALLYVIVAGFITNPGSGPQSIGLVVASASGNWSVTIVSVPSGKLPASTFVVIRDANYTILFPRTPFENLTAARWASQKVLYQDAHPSTLEIQASDRLLVDQVRYPRGSVLEISDDAHLLAIQTLQ